MPLAAGLYVVSTPIGNLEDMSARALRILQQVDRIAAEDTRHSAKLLSHFAIQTPQMSLHEHNERDRSAAIVGMIEAGQAVALISDAGTPLISDPGFPLIKALRERDLRVMPIPGCCALVAALSVAGLPTDRFAFEGFLSAKPQARRARLETLVDEPRTLVFYESTHRIEACLADFVETFGPERLAVLAREITKTYESIKQAELAELAAWLADNPQERKGEFVLVVAGAAKPDRQQLNPEAERLLGILLEELGTKQAASLTAKITGLKKSLLYQRALALKPS